MNWFKKKTREQQIEKRTESVFAELIGTAEFEFTDLESVQIINNVRRRLSEHLKNKRDMNMELSVNHNQTANEITNAINFIE